MQQNSTREARLNFASKYYYIYGKYFMANTNEIAEKNSHNIFIYSKDEKKFFFCPRPESANFPAAARNEVAAFRRRRAEK